MSHKQSDTYQTNRWSILAATRLLESANADLRNGATILLQSADDGPIEYAVSEYQWIVNASDHALLNRLSELL